MNVLSDLAISGHIKIGIDAGVVSAEDLENRRQKCLKLVADISRNMFVGFSQ